MAFKGKLIGALLGSFAGPMGTILGGLIGHLFDRATDERQAAEGLSSYSYRTAPDSIQAAQLSFISSLIGLSMAVANADGQVKVSEVEALKSFFKTNFPYSEEDHGLIQKMIDETFRQRNKINTDGLCGYYRSISSLSGRLLLLRLLFKIAVADTQGVSSQEEALIRRIAGLLGIDSYNYKSIRAEFVKEESKAYQILGVSPESSEAEIRSAYRKLASQHHPDRVNNLGEEFVRVAEEKFKLINEAYDEIRQEQGF